MRWRGLARARCGCASAPGSCFWRAGGLGFAGDWARGSWLYPGTASKWRVRYAGDRMDGLSETGDRGADRSMGRSTGNAFLRCWISHRPQGIQLDGAVAGAGGWTSTSSISGGSCVPRRSTCRGGNRGVRAPTPTLWRKRQTSLAFIWPPDNAVVLSVDEKPSIQALERPGVPEAAQWAGDDWTVA